MDVILGNRRSGKTTALIDISHEKQIPIVCHSEQAVWQVKAMAKEKGIDIPEPISLNGYLMQWRGQIHGHRVPEKILIDDAELIIRTMFPEVDGMALSTNSIGMNVNYL